MPFDALVEEKIQEAMARGDFDDLPGAGKPLDLDSYFAAPEDLRMAWSVLRSAGYMPEEVELLREIAGLKARLTAASGDAERTRLRKQLDDKVLSLNLLLEQRRRARRPRRRRS